MGASGLELQRPAEAHGKVTYTAKTHTRPWSAASMGPGDRENGVSRSSDGRLDINLSPRHRAPLSEEPPTSRVSVVDGHKRIRRGVHRPMAEWDVLIKDNHAAYSTWDEFERNRKAIANNATGMSSALTRGAAREGELLLPGLLRCGHCGRKLHVHYGSKLGRYNC
jgi:hypothetical protein